MYICIFIYIYACMHVCDEVYYAACSLPVILKNSCRKLLVRKVLIEFTFHVKSSRNRDSSQVEIRDC